jgi:hypothetical protein
MVEYLIRRMLLSALMTLTLLPSGAVGAQKPQLAVPNNLKLAIMIKTTLIAYNHGNLTGNYTVLRDLAAPSFRKANTPARLAAIFQKLRQRNIDLGPIVLFQPKLSQKPLVDENGLLKLSGFFATRPERVVFDLAYQEVDGKWRLFLLGVKTRRGVAVRPTVRSPKPAAAVQTTGSNTQPAAGLPLPRSRPRR